MFNSYINPPSTDKIKKNKTKVPEIIMYRGNETVSNKEAFCAYLSRVVHDSDELATFLDCMEKFSEAKLFGEISNASRNFKEYSHLIEHYSQLSNYEIDDYTFYVDDDRNKNVFASAQKALWNLGSSTLNLGYDPISMSVDQHPDLVTCLTQTESFFRNARKAKNETIKNTITKLFDCLDSKVTRNLVTTTEKLNFLDELLDNFEEGNLKYKFHVSKFRFAKEAGAHLPHTLSPKDWIAESVLQLFDHEFDGSLIIAFQATQVSDVTRYKSKSCLLIEDDETSAFHCSVTPALHCQDIEIDENGNEMWAWRKVQKVIKTQVSAKAAKFENITAEERNELLKKETRKYAESFVGKGDNEIEWKGAFGILSDDLADKVGKKFILKFYKRGYSKSNVVLENPDYVHIVSKAIALTIGKSFQKILLGDLNSVVLLPIPIWACSKFESHSKGQPYLSKFGMKALSGKVDSLDPYFVFFGLSLTRAMFRSFDKGEKGEAFNMVAFGAELIAATKLKGSYKSLLSTTVTKLDVREKLLGIYGHLYPGEITGIWLAPHSTKIGKQGLEEVNSMNGFDRQLSTYTVPTKESEREKNYTFSFDLSDFPGYSEESSFDFSDEEPSEGVDDKEDSEDITYQATPEDFGLPKEDEEFHRAPFIPGLGEGNDDSTTSEVSKLEGTFGHLT